MITPLSIADLPKAERPPCIECGSNHVMIKDARRWSCMECGRTWVDAIKKMVIDRTGRPPCPYCKSERINLHAMNRYYCTECGRTFKRETH